MQRSSVPRANILNEDNPRRLSLNKRKVYALVFASAGSFDEGTTARCTCIQSGKGGKERRLCRTRLAARRSGRSGEGEKLCQRSFSLLSSYVRVEGALRRGLKSRLLSITPLIWYVYFLIWHTSRILDVIPWEVGVTIHCVFVL